MDESTHKGGAIYGKVAAVWTEGERICFAVNRGKDHGVKKREYFVFGVQVIADPDSGEALGDYAPYTGWVAEVRPKLTICLLERYTSRTEPESIGLTVGADVRTLEATDIRQSDEPLPGLGPK